MRSRALAAALLLAALPAAAGARAVPALTGPVVDEARLLDARSARQLEALCRAARAVEGGRGVQLQYLIVRSLEGDALEDFSMRVAEAWKLGDRKAGNGVLVLVAAEERKVRIEVGGGVEGGLTDAQAGRIIRNTIAPAFRQQRYGAGLHEAGVQILAALGALPQGVAPRGGARGPPGLSLLLVLGIVLLLLGAVVRSALLGGRRSGFRGRGPWGGGPFIGGGFGGGGFSGGGGGGGWSGGGGGFSGGGASGGW